MMGPALQVPKMHIRNPSSDDNGRDTILLVVPAKDFVRNPASDCWT